jgi:hypothetical protein
VARERAAVGVRETGGRFGSHFDILIAEKA